MLRAKNYLNKPMFYRIIQNIILAQNRFTISEADWHELMKSPCTMRLSIARASANNWTRGLQLADLPPPNQPH